MEKISVYEREILSAFVKLIDNFDAIRNVKIENDCNRMYGIFSEREFAYNEFTHLNTDTRQKTINQVENIYSLFCEVFSFAMQYFEMVDTYGKRKDEHFKYYHTISFLRNINFHHKYTKHKMNYVCDKEALFYFFKKEELWFQFGLTIQDDKTYEMRNVFNTPHNPNTYFKIACADEEYFNVNNKIVDYFKGISSDFFKVYTSAVFNKTKQKSYEKRVKVEINVLKLLIFLFSPNYNYIFKQTQ